MRAGLPSYMAKQILEFHFPFVVEKPFSQASHINASQFSIDNHTISA
jgi:hypothetical protein